MLQLKAMVLRMTVRSRNISYSRQEESLVIDLRLCHGERWLIYNRQIESYQRRHPGHGNGQIPMGAHCPLWFWLACR